LTGVYTRRLLLADLAPAGIATVVVAAGQVWVLRNVIAIADAASSSALAAVYGPDPHIVAIAAQAANVVQTFAVETRVVLLAGETLKAQAITGNWHVTLTGYVFDA
jgi:hypothetical protein